MLGKATGLGLGQSGQSLPQCISKLVKIPLWDQDFFGILTLTPGL